MARKTSPTLTDAELRLMEVVWKRGSATVGEVVEDFPEVERPAYSTVLTTLRILEGKGYLRHEKRGRAYLYFPIVDRGEVRRKALRYVLSRFFGDSPELLVLSMLRHEEIDQEELERLKRLVEEKGRAEKKENRGGH